MGATVLSTSRPRSAHLPSVPTHTTFSQTSCMSSSKSLRPEPLMSPGPKTHPHNSQSLWSNTSKPFSHSAPLVGPAAFGEQGIQSGDCSRQPPLCGVYVWVTSSPFSVDHSAYEYRPCSIRSRVPAPERGFHLTDRSIPTRFPKIPPHAWALLPDIGSQYLTLW